MPWIFIVYHKPWTILHGQEINTRRKNMLIGELAEITGCSRDTIRFYEKKGLIHELYKRDEQNNYKIYNKQTVDRIMLIQQGKTFGFTLKEIQKLIEDLEKGLVSAEYMLEVCENKLNTVKQKVIDLNTIKKQLEEKIKILSLGECKA